MDAEKSHGGGCLCGAVTYRATGDLRPVVACHCGQCRRTSGHHVAATSAARDRLEITGERNLSWYESSPGVRRGFCGVCGSNLFWENQSRPTVSIMAGSLDQPTDLQLVAHIYCAFKGDYYELEDGLPTFQEGDDGL